MKKALFALLAIALMVMAFGCMAPEEEAPAAPVVQDEPLPEPEPTTTTPETTPSGAQVSMLTDVVCLGDRITATIANTGDADWVLNEDIKIILNGGWDKEPGCAAESLAPGENMVCDQIDFPIVQKAGKKNVVVVTAAGERQTEDIVCAAAQEPEETGEETTEE